jgi:hypothetical protein
LPNYLFNKNMGINSTLNSLKIDQIQFIYKKIFGSDSTFKSSSKMVNKIYDKLRDYSQNQLKNDPQKSSQQITAIDIEMLSLWKQYILNVITKKKVKEELQEEKNQINISLMSLSVNAQEVDTQVEEICRNILVLLYKSLSDQERGKFIDTLKKELEDLNVKLSKEDFEKILFGNSLLGAVGLPLVIIPIIANTMLKRLTQGFMGWLLVEILGQQAAQKSVLAFLAGPIGWAINIFLILGTAGFAFFKYQSEKKKLNFIQTIFSIYSYSYFNHRFNK